MRPRQRSKRTPILLVLVAVVLLIAGRRSYSTDPEIPETPTPDSEPGSGSRIPIRPQTHDKPVWKLPEYVQSQKAEHHFGPNGLLQVNPLAEHPILELISRAEDRWNSKLERASGTFEAAITEYERRYKRGPPRGFHQWWQYVEKHNIQLPDEYDQIYEDIEPFWGVSPTDLQRIVSEMEESKHRDSYTIGKIGDGPVEIVHTNLPAAHRAGLLHASLDIIDLLRDVQEHIPPFRAVFSPHDAPNMLTEFSIRQRAVTAAADNRYINLEDMDAVHTGWKAACHPKSTALLPSGTLSFNKTFIHNHHLSMDMCHHPRHIDLHGQFISYGGVGPRAQPNLSPQFSYCSTTLHHDIRVATGVQWVEDILPRSNDPPFEKKPDHRLGWRGRNTGTHNNADERWKMAQRTRLVRFAAELNGTARVLKSDGNKAQPIGEGEDVLRALLNPALFDVAFAGQPINCKPGYCEKMAKMYEWRGLQGSKETGRYKYIMDVDGNGWSSRFQKLMTTNALIFKSTLYPEWNMDRIVPWVHYIPIQLDLSDLYDALIFFRGDMNGLGAHQDLAAKIALRSRQWAKTFWRRQDMTAYNFRLMLEYARVMSNDRKAMTYGAVLDPEKDPAKMPVARIERAAADALKEDELAAAHALVEAHALHEAGIP